MTRINSAIRVKLLTDEHLLAEHREIKRLPSVYLKRITSHAGLSNLPERFTLGTGHVLFFINKPEFTHHRYSEIRGECLNRGFNVENYSDNWKVYENLKPNKYTPDKIEYDSLVERISERLLQSKKPYWHYYGKKITKEDAVSLLKKLIN